MFCSVAPVGPPGIATSCKAWTSAATSARRCANRAAVRSAAAAVSTRSLAVAPLTSSACLCKIAF